VAQKIINLGPDYMVMGERGMADMGEMQMQIPDNTLPMMTGSGPFGPLEMGGMFTVVKVREGLAKNDYKDPGWYKHPQGTVAYEWTGATPVATRPAPEIKPPARAAVPAQEVRVRKPTGHGNH